MRTGREKKITPTTNKQSIVIGAHLADLRQPNLELSDFRLNNTDKQSAEKIRNVFDQYMLLKLASCGQMMDIQAEKIRNVFDQYMLLKLASCGQMMDIQSYLTVADNISPPEQSNVIYYKILHQRCDDKETLLSSAQLSSSAYQLDIQESSDSCESQGEDGDLETEVNQIMYNVFGSEEESDSDMSRDDL